MASQSAVIGPSSVQLMLVKDFFTGLTPSSNVVDQNGNIASLTNNLYKKIDRPISGGTSTYIEYTNYDISYMVRIAPTLTIPESLKIKLKFRGFMFTDNASYSFEGVSFYFKLNGVQLGDADSFASFNTSQTFTFNLSSTQMAEILKSRNKLDYMILEIKASIWSSEPGHITYPLTINQNARIYAIEVYYDTPDGHTYSNSETATSNTFTFYSKTAPLNGTHFINSSGATSGYGESKNFILGTTSGTAPDGTFIVKQSDASGAYFPVSFGVTGVLDHINRADLYLRYNNPNGSSGNCTDGYEVYGYHTNYPEPVIYGAGQYLSGSYGFYNTSAELSWLDINISSSSGIKDDVRYKNTESLQDIDFRILGIPSGGQISAMELIVIKSDSSDNFNLFMSGYEPTPTQESDDLTLYMNSIKNDDGTILLYTGSSVSESGNFNLFTSGDITASFDSSSLDLYVGGLDLSSGTSNLFTSGSPPGENSNLNLYISGKQLETSTLDLYLFNNLESGSTTLHTHGFSSNSGTQNLYLNNIVTESGNFNLYTSGAYVNYSSLNLYMSGTTPVVNTKNLNLVLNHPFYLEYDDFGYLIDSSGNYILDGSGNPILYGGGTSFHTTYLPLYMNSEASPDNFVNLYLENNDIATNGSVNLYISGKNTYEDSLNLFLLNDSSGVNRKTNLYTAGRYTYEESNLNLFISQLAEGASNIIDASGVILVDEYGNEIALEYTANIDNSFANFVVCNNISIDDKELNLYNFGSNLTSGQTNMFISGNQVPNSLLYSYIRGF